MNINILLSFRAHDQNVIFSNTRDYLEFLHILIGAKKKYSSALYAFCLMHDHCKIIAGFSNGTDIRGFMRYINRRYQDHLFVVYAEKNMRLRNEIPVLLQDSFELFNAVKKVEFGPVAAGVSNLAAQYPYSSAYFRNCHVLEKVS